MKLAIQFFGHLRSFRETHEFVKNNILSVYDCDVFMHTWSEEEHSDPTWHHMQQQESKLTDKAEISQYYSLKGLEVEDNSIIQEDGFFNLNNNISLRGLKAMLYSQNKVNKIRTNYQNETGVEYDYVITLRPDIMPLTKLDLSVYQAEFEFTSKCSIHFSNGAHSHFQETKSIYTPLASDLFFIAKPKTMDMLCDAINDFKRYFVDFSTVNPGGIASPEGSFIERLHHKGVLPRFYALPYIVKRTSGNNHLIAGMRQMKFYPHKVTIPDFVQDKMAYQDTWLLRCFAKLSTKHIRKVQKELIRTARKIQYFADRLDHKKQ
ncbi:hypothetical protein [Vibrio cionasavignyae]|uniref:hypothetical protein n=1 Tax=Vibrio cionasavignyae TaxID=2910252 RepID=UPI003D147FD9